MTDYSALPWKVELGAISIPDTYLIHCAYGPIAIIKESPHISVGDFKQNMETLQKALDCYTRFVNCDFDTVHEAGRRLGEILVRDGAKTAVDVGAEDYVVRAVIEALLGNSDTL